ncbi:MAG: hypothetical protein DHS80DRAFT_8404, partial [Piptocephalis tieghemiana]
IFGYLLETHALKRSILQVATGLIRQRKLPLVLDLDDTLVRLVSDDVAGSNKYVPVAIAERYAQDRIRMLSDGRRVVVAPGVDEFLDWAKAKFEMSVCSVGDAKYVRGVCEVLDAGCNRIGPLRHSARAEHDYLDQKLRTLRSLNLPVPTRDGLPPPPKHLGVLYPFVHMPTCGDGSIRKEDWYGLPLIMDDQTRSWPPEQHGNIVVMEEKDPVEHMPFNLDLQVARGILEELHKTWFASWDA